MIKFPDFGDMFKKEKVVKLSLKEIKKEWLKRSSETAKFIAEMDRKPKMTREEAVELAKAYGNNYPWDEGEIRLLEALGLIKFDEKSKTLDDCIKGFYKKPSSEKDKYIFFPHPDGADNVSVLQADAVATLEKYGYQVSKKEKEPTIINISVPYSVEFVSHYFEDVKKALEKAGYSVIKR